MRIIRRKGPDRQGRRQVRYVVTILLDPDAYPADEVASLYLHRWEIEVLFRRVQQVLHFCRKAFDGLGDRPILRSNGIREMWRRIAEHFVIERPGRNEPRRGKRRPKCTQWLQKPRHPYFEHFRSDDPPLKILDHAV